MPATDEWYVRLPDGKVVLARSSTAVRHHLESGRLPRDIQVRRTPRDPWGALERYDEFADLAPRTRLSSRAPDNHSAGNSGHLELATVGVRGFLDHLWTSLDGTLQPARLWTVALLGCSVGVALTVLKLGHHLASPWPELLALALVLAVWVLQGWSVVVLTRLIFLEMAQMRPATWREAATGMGGRMVRVLLAQFMVGLVVGGLLAVLRLPATVSMPENLSWLPPILAGIGIVFRMVLETVLWVVLALGLLLGPVVVVEECSSWTAVRQWLALCGQYQERVLLYEALALAMAVALALPAVLVVVGVSWSSGLVRETAGMATFHILGGLALTPALTFLLGANVYIYVNLRYEINTREH